MLTNLKRFYRINCEYIKLKILEKYKLMNLKYGKYQTINKKIE